jgi:hypothetical protein
VQRIERPASGSYAPAPVEIKQKATGYLGEKSVSGKSVYQDLRIISCLLTRQTLLSLIARLTVHGQLH